MPIYSPKPLTSSDVKNGKDAALAYVTLGLDGNYYLTNSVKYATKWDCVAYLSTLYSKCYCFVRG